jgi:hypothetical protein
LEEITTVPDEVKEKKSKIDKLKIGTIIATFVFFFSFMVFEEYKSYVNFSVSQKRLAIYAAIALVLNIAYAWKIKLIGELFPKKDKENRQEKIKNFQEFKKKLWKEVPLGMWLASLALVAVFSADIFASILDIPLLDKAQAMDSERVKVVTIHEAGHAYVNEELFKGTTSTLRIFRPKDIYLVGYLLGSSQANGLPAGVHFAPDRKIEFKKDIEDKIKVSLAGMAAERILGPKKETSMGGSGDMENIRKFVIEMVNNGLADVGPVHWDALSQDERNEIYKEIVQEQLKDTEDIIRKNSEKILRLAEELEKEKVLSGDEVRKIIE